MSYNKKIALIFLTQSVCMWIVKWFTAIVSV